MRTTSKLRPTLSCAPATISVYIIYMLFALRRFGSAIILPLFLFSALAKTAAQTHIAPILPQIPDGTHNIENYGAIGNGVVTNTKPIQAAINAASAAGGGIVEVPAGTFLCGPIQMA